MAAVSMNVTLPDEVAARLVAEADRRGVTVDQLIDELSSALPTPGRRHRLRIVGIGASGRTDPIDIHSERADLAAKKLVEDR